MLWIRDILERIQIRTLLFSSVAFEMPTKNNFFAYYFLKVHLHQSSSLPRQKVIKKSQTVEIKVFLIFFLIMEEQDPDPVPYKLRRIRFRVAQKRTDPRIRIHNTAFWNTFREWLLAKWKKLLGLFLSSSIGITFFLSLTRWVDSKKKIELLLKLRSPVYLFWFFIWGYVYIEGIEGSLLLDKM